MSHPERFNSDKKTPGKVLIIIGLLPVIPLLAIGLLFAGMFNYSGGILFPFYLMIEKPIFIIPLIPFIIALVSGLIIYFTNKDKTSMQKASKEKRIYYQSRERKAEKGEDNKRHVYRYGKD